MRYIRYILIVFLLLSAGFIFSGETPSGRVVYDFSSEGRFQHFSEELPGNLTFAGEPVPLHNPKVYKALKKELNRIKKWGESAEKLTQRAEKWYEKIVPVLDKHNIPEDFKYLAFVESNFRNDTSARGAVGFWQFIEPTGKSLGLAVNDEIDERLSPIRSTQAACKYFLRAKRHFKDWTSIAASYNIGIGGLQRAYKKQGINSYYDARLNKETARYIYKVLAIKLLSEQPETIKLGKSIKTTGKQK